MMHTIEYINITIRMHFTSHCDKRKTPKQTITQYMRFIYTQYNHLHGHRREIKRKREREKESREERRSRQKAGERV